jgi:hypothetical protein
MECGMALQYCSQHERLFVVVQERWIGFAEEEVNVNDLPRSKLRGIKPPLAYSYGPPVWRGEGLCIVQMAYMPIVVHSSDQNTPAKAEASFEESDPRD